MTILAALLLTFLSRLAYYLAFPFKNLDTDAVNHLMLVQAIRRNNNRVPDKLEKFILDTNDYPNGFHRVMALLPFSLSLYEKFGGLVPILMDTATLGLFAGIITATGGHEYGWLLLYPLIRLLWGYEVRAFLFGERAYGIFFGNLYLASTVLLVQTNDWWWAALALVGFLGFSTASQFTWQATLFFTLMLSAALLKWDYLAIYAACFVGAAILSQGYSVKMIKGLIRHSYFYKTHILKTNWGIRNFYAEWGQVFRRLRLSSLIQLLYENSLAKWLTNYPISIPFLVIWGQSGFPVTPWTVYALCGFILLPIIATEAFKFWGEPERYLEYCILPIFWYLSFHKIADHPWLFGVAVLMGLSSVAFQLKLKQKGSKGAVSLENDFESLENLLRELPESVILPIPLRCAYRPGYTIDKHHYVGHFSNIGEGKLYQALVELLPDHMGFPGKNLENYVAQYKIEYIVLHKKYYSQLGKKRLNGQPYYDFSPYELQYDTPFFQCYKVIR